MTYDKLCRKHENKVDIFEHPVQRECEKLGIKNVKGLYKNGHIAIDRTLTNREKKCVLAEELGHHYTSAGNILDIKYAIAAKQERRAREWGATQVIDMDKLIEATKLYDNVYQIADELDVTYDTLIYYLNYLVNNYDRLNLHEIESQQEYM